MKPSLDKDITLSNKQSTELLVTALILRIVTYMREERAIEIIYTQSFSKLGLCTYANC